VATEDTPAAPAVRCTVFDTLFGALGVAWHAQGLTRVLLPDSHVGLTRQRLLHGLPASAELQAGEVPPAFVAQAIEQMRAHLAGSPRHLREVPLDLARVGPFEQRVYAAARALDPGRTCTYGELARAIEDPSALRAVGQALGHNPWPLVVPCHRVLAAGGGLGGFSAPGGADTKRRLLVHELAMCPREDELF
jgi:methylated-DNA-[protein]-cysteine S-methyltransferase